jgi:hypothetical protein
MSMGLDPVDRPRWLDDEFIQDVLRSREEYSAVCVVKSEVQLAVGKGENYSSTTYRVAVEFKGRKNNEETEMTGLIIKMLSAVESMVKFLTELKSFEKETELYQITVPAMFNFLQQNTQGREVQHWTPFCYKTSRPHTLVLEDLMTLHCKMANRHDRLDLLHCTLALKGLAKFHAASVALYDKNPNCMADYVENMYNEKNRHFFVNFMTSAINALADVVERWYGFEKYGDKLRGVLPTYWDRIANIVKPVPDSLSVLTHGDFWVNNMMFHYCPETGKPDQVRLIDFQIASYSTPVLDLQYFIHTSASEPERSEYTEHLLQVYHTELRDTLQTLGCDHHIYTFEQLKKEYEDRLFFGLITACTVLSVVLADPAEAFDMQNVREDGSQIDPKSVEKTYSGSRYKEAFQKLLPQFERKGLL